MNKSEIIKRLSKLEFEITGGRSATPVRTELDDEVNGYYDYVLLINLEYRPYVDKLYHEKLQSILNECKLKIDKLDADYQNSVQHKLAIEKANLELELMKIIQNEHNQNT